MAAQQSASADSVVPAMVKFAGTLNDVDGKPLTGTVGVTFLLYKEQAGGAPVWMETQNIQADNKGNYTAVLGARSAAGIPIEVFSTGEARWLGVQPEGQPEHPRVLLVSVPYAMKASDAETLGGFPPSAFLLAGGNSAAGMASAETGSGLSPAVSGTGTTDYVPLWLNATGTPGKFRAFSVRQRSHGEDRHRHHHPRFDSGCGRQHDSARNSVDPWVALAAGDRRSYSQHGLLLAPGGTDSLGV